MNQLLQDLRYGLRGLLRSPGATAVALVSLTLGIGANAVIFSLVNALVLKPLPVHQPGRLVRINFTRNGQEFFTASYPEYQDLVSGTRSFEGLTGYNLNSVILGVGGEVREEWMEIVTSGYFSVLGIAPRLGRGFLPGADRERAEEVVISDRLWQARFRADLQVIGRSVKLNGHPVTVVGVAPPGFAGTFAGFDIGLWVPAGLLPTALPGERPLSDRSYRFLMFMGRLAPGVSVGRARAEVAAAAKGWPLTDRPGAGPVGVELRPATGAHSLIQGLVKAFLALLMSVVGLVLLIACANVANLLLARAEARRRETAVRLSLGAGRARLVRQHLTESLLLAAIGSAGGVMLAFWLSRLLLAFRPPVGIPVSLDTSLDLRVLAFAGALALGTTVVFGLAPALRVSRTDLTSALKGLGTGGGRSRLRPTLVVAQVAVSTLLLVGATLLVRSLRNSATIDPGFDSKHFLVLDPGPRRLGYDEPRTRALWQRLATRLGTLPGVEGVTLALMIPLGDRGDQMGVARGEDPAPDPNDQRLMDYNFVSPGYFSALRTPLVAGREFSQGDAPRGVEVAIVNQALAASLWPGASALGHRLHVIDRGNRVHEVEIVGVVRDSKYRSLGETARPVVYLASTQWYRWDMRLLVRTRGDPRRLVAAVRAAVRETDPDVPATPTTMDEETAFSLVPVRLAGSVLAGAGAIALLLAAIGIFGVVSYSVARQYRDIGIRMALGASRARVRGLFVGQGLRLTSVGLILGLGAAAGVTRFLRGLLYGVSPGDPASFAAIGAFVSAVSVLACYLPARRATRVSPLPCCTRSDLRNPDG
jgi:predicted permease